MSRIAAESLGMSPGRVLPACRVALVALPLLLAGCPGGNGGRSLELTGGEARGRLPEAVVDLVPADAILCHDEEGQEGAYHLWILRRPGGTWLEIPDRERPGFESHDMPPSALEVILQSKLPSLDRGRPLERRCRYTHWHDRDGAEILIREIITDQGWFAGVERVKP
jgi:hypothetical protein